MYRVESVPDCLWLPRCAEFQVCAGCGPLIARHALLWPDDSPEWLEIVDDIERVHGLVPLGRDDRFAYFGSRALIGKLDIPRHKKPISALFAVAASH